MADDNTDSATARHEAIDQPDERIDAFFNLVGTTPDTFGGAVADALRHAETAPVDPAAEPWIPIGPRNVGGAVRCFAQDPSTPATLYAGTAQGGLWKSEDSGYSWRPLGEPQMILPVGAVAVAPSDSQVLYVGTGEQAYWRTPQGAFGKVHGRGFYRSDDGGLHFKQLTGPPPGDAKGANQFARIAVDPNEPTRCWVASDTGLWRYEDDSVTRELTGLTPAVTETMITDVVLARDPTDANRYVLLAGVYGVGIYRGIFDRERGTMTWSRAAGLAPPAVGPPLFGRIRLAFSNTQVGVPLPRAYAIMEDNGLSGAASAAVHSFPSPVYVSSDFGQTFAPASPTSIDPPPAVVPPAPPAQPGQAYYSLCIAVDPTNARRVVAGYVDLFLSTNGGVSWTKILDWRLYDRGDRAQHADQHNLHFDHNNPRQLWVCNDGGISVTTDFLTLQTPPAPPTCAWRKKSYGIEAAQFTDVSTHPVFPYIVGGGMQDGGTFVSYGGPTWYRLYGGDGGPMIFDPRAPHNRVPPPPPPYSLEYVVTWQGEPTRSGVVKIALGPPPVPLPPLGSLLYPENASLLPDTDPPFQLMVPVSSEIQPTAFPNPNPATPYQPPFIGVIDADPAAPNRFVVGRAGFKPPVPAVPPAPPNPGAGFFTVDGTNFTALTTPAAGPTVLTGDVSALTYVPLAPNPDIWMGTTTGQVFLGSGLPPTGPMVGRFPATAGTRVTSIAVHPANANVVAVSTGVNQNRWGGVFLSHDKGASWLDITLSTVAEAPPGGLPHSPITCVVFHPTETTTLFAATIGGVYVIRNLPAPGGAPGPVPNFTPSWATYNLNLPRILVMDLAVTPVTHTLRCATYGRGVYECNLAGTPDPERRIPAVRLSIRSHVTDDARTYPPANLFFDDPRLPASPPAPTSFDQTHALDIRVDAPGFIRSEAFDFGEAIDGVEFDETLICDKPLVGDTNFVYVQVHNRGSQTANNVRVYLYYADAGATPPQPPPPAPPLLPTPPPIDARMNYPDTPADDSPWQLAAPVQTVGFVRPGEPVVVKLEWVPPLRIKDNVALLALCTNDQDALASLPAGTAVAAFVASNPRAALRILGVNRDAVFLRDGVDDSGTRGSVAWGGRSPDIIVAQTAVANPDDPAGQFKDLAEQRVTDRVHPGDNIIYVRVFNRTQVAVDASVRVYQLPHNDPLPSTGWTAIGSPATVSGIPPRGWRFATVPWAGVADPDPAVADYKCLTLLAVASVVDASGTPLDPFPDPSAVTDLDSFWRFFLRAPLANNAAMRALRFVAP